jgi:hypothetical protein
VIETIYITIAIMDIILYLVVTYNSNRRIIPIVASMTNISLALVNTGIAPVKMMRGELSGGNLVNEIFCWENL